jgi:hypothetical protein
MHRIRIPAIPFALWCFACTPWLRVLDFDIAVAHHREGGGSPIQDPAPRQCSDGPRRSIMGVKFCPSCVGPSSWSCSPGLATCFTSGRRCVQREALLRPMCTARLFLRSGSVYVYSLYCLPASLRLPAWPAVAEMKRDLFINNRILTALSLEKTTGRR